MLEQIKQRLGANYIEDTDNVIKDIIDDMTSIACAASNRKEDDKKLFPYIKKAVISEYLCRGAEGLLSRNEGSVSSTFNDIEKKLRIDVSTIRRLL
ncbi:uncharacterized protein BN577_00383 [Clostridium sp. CAG:269]|jgi:hypothetical protein|nr:hypothetical protein [Clostridia bacterium]CDE54950.1 uncharacterized protein BN577_00383 [Clostridium sp. CAG:269]DAL24416.1 MAG TPA_asm: tail connector protein [Caudoviricetes sp.]DAP68335.1 MAG TPA: tail connector protein [Caudoviricetes sp.]DAV08848.1 MAG TPA: tail connector protein [Caudoviricetes sp.]